MSPVTTLPRSASLSLRLQIRWDRQELFERRAAHDRVRSLRAVQPGRYNKIELNGDTMDAKIPAGTLPAAMTYAVTKDGQSIAAGRIAQFANFIYTDIIQLPALAAGKYQVKLALVDVGGQTLVARGDLSFEKKDEAKEFAKWWHNKIGDTEKVLPPFEALKIKGDSITCTRRSYQLDGLGLPRKSSPTAARCRQSRPRASWRWWAGEGNTLSQRKGMSSLPVAKIGGGIHLQIRGGRDRFHREWFDGAGRAGGFESHVRTAK